MAVSIQQIRQAGIVGAGGAGFPTYVKLSAQADTVILNAAECEPLLHKDKEILRRFPDRVLAGLQTAMELVGASSGIIGIKGKYREVIAELEKRVSPPIKIVPLADTYPAGDEQILVFDVTGKIVPPGGIPLSVGTVVINVETALNIAQCDTTPVIEKYLTVAGAVAEPVTVRVPIGTPLSDCVAAAGGPTVPDPHYMIGGVMMGYLEENHQAPVLRTTGGIIVLPGDHPLIQRRKQSWNQIARIGRSACDQCSYCTELCPRWLLGHPIEPHRAMRSLGFNLSRQSDVLGTLFCCECNLCSLYSCPENLDPKNVCVENKRRLIAEGRRWEKPPLNTDRARLHMRNRRAPMSRLIRKLNLHQYTNTGPLVDITLQPQRVTIKLKQHIGAVCKPVVQTGQTVSKGETIAVPPDTPEKPALGVPIHASISGMVVEVTDEAIVITAQ